MTEPIIYGAVLLLFYRNEGTEVLLLKRAGTGYADGQWSVVAGRMDGGEEVKVAAVREAKEEAGVVIDPSGIEVVGVMHRRNGSSEWVDFYLKVHAWEGEIMNCEPHKCEDLRWFNIHELPVDTIPYVAEAVRRDHSSMWFVSEGWE
ncbi:NUDIX hydrolase [Paenibacillus tuaregi]|uniref:NUDIX hydrolase n=1 Tax=Paenibacillus tuaregi TaxID=1816681 RepID=UPI000837AC52|nr:NUDIX domain-containing protein [Paenibacillus tuaregi]